MRFRPIIRVRKHAGGVTLHEVLGWEVREPNGWHRIDVRPSEYLFGQKAVSRAS